ncbi:MAG TPA: hypothetical protein VHO25_24845 [Polyangiaceae bacterium]|nr:hypothetical protein [Polyangiaceae bacterium]
MSEPRNQTKLTVESAADELRKIFPDRHVIVEVCFPEFSNTKRYYIQVGENGQDFHAASLASCMAMVRKWREEKSK